MKTLENTEFITRPAKSRVGVGDGGEIGVNDGDSGDGSDNSGHDDELLPQDCASTDSSTKAARIMVKYKEVDGGKSGAGGKLVKKLSKSPKSLGGLKNLERLSDWRNVYQSTDFLSIKYKELELPLELWQFSSFFC